MYTDDQWLTLFFFFSSRRRHTRWPRDWSSDVCSSDLRVAAPLRDRAGLRLTQYGARGDGQLDRGAEPRLGQHDAPRLAVRSEERRVGEEWRRRRSPQSRTRSEQLAADA